MSVTREAALAAIRDTPVGVLAYRNGDRPVAVAVTPFAGPDGVVVTSTLALVRKMELLRADRRCALLAGGVAITGRASLTVDADGERFRHELLSDEKRKYPPTAQLDALPFSRRLLWWYFGRVLADITILDSMAIDGSDRVTITALDAQGFPAILPVHEEVDLDSDQIMVADTRCGPAVLHVHEEHDHGADLRQLTLHGRLENGVLHVERRTGTLRPPADGATGQIRTLLALGRAARRSRHRVDVLRF